VYDVATGSTLLSKIPPRFMVPAIAVQYRLSEPELGRLADLVPKGRGAVDVGVWWGPWTWWLARRALQVHSFEPNAELVGKLTPVLPRNVTLHQVALSDRSGESSLWIPGGGTGTEGRASLESTTRTDDTWREETVVTSRLDDFDLGDVGFVKVDVEGHEFAVLKGAVNLLTTQRPTVLVEIEEHAHREGQLDAIVEFFGDHSYEATYLSRRSWHPIEDLDRQAVRAMANKVASHGYVVDSLLYARRYVHNFVFRPV
jgi:FkbM family methyltransferase